MINCSPIQNTTELQNIKEEEISFNNDCFN